MATGMTNGPNLGTRRTRNIPSQLDLNKTAVGVALGTPNSRNGAPYRQPHDSVLESNTSRRSSALKSPFRTESHREYRETPSWHGDDGIEAQSYASMGQAPTSRLPPPRIESLQHLGAATSPLARTVDDEFLTTTGSPPRKASAGSSPNIGQEQWWRSESRPGSAQPSPRFANLDELRGSATGDMPSPGFAGVSKARLRGMTASSAQSPTLNHSASYGDLRMSNRTLPTNVYRPSRRQDTVRDSTQSSLRREPFIPPFAEEARASIRSAWTTHSSGFLGSDRSSVMTRASSTSELNKGNQRIDDLLMSVEDAINMYSNGFTDDSPEQSEGEDSGDDSPPQSRIIDVLDINDGPMLLHSATFDERSPALERTPMPPRSSSDPVTENQVQSVMYQVSYPLDSHVGQQRYTTSNYATAVEHQESTHASSSRAVYSGASAFAFPFSSQPDSSSAQMQFEERSFSTSPYNNSKAVLHNSSSEPPPSFSTFPSSISQTYTESSATHVEDDIFAPGARQKAPPQPPDPSEYQGLFPPPSGPTDLDRGITSKTSTTDFVNPRSPPSLPPPPVARDRYGFKKSTQYISVEQYDAWDAEYSPYLERRRSKWHLLMKQYGLSTENPVRFPPKTEKVKRYIRKGIPPEWRGAAWFWYSGGPGRLSQNSGLYWSLIEQIQQGKLSDSDREHIERDLNRTFPDNVQFKPDPPRRSASKGNAELEPGPPPDTAIIRSLRRVLQAFALHNSSIGYCQSLNFLAGLLLIFLDQDEEKSFIMLDVITSMHLPGTHAKVLEANVDIGVLMMCIKESMPAVWAKIDDNAEEMIPRSTNGNASISRLPTVSLATTAWFMSCYIGNLPIECVLRTWDIFFYEGSKTLFRIALTIFKLGEADIRNINEHMEIFQLVQTIPRRLLDANGLMEACYKKRNGFQYLSQDTVDQRRVERRKILAEERARKFGAKLAQQADAGTDAGDDENRSRMGMAGNLKRAASRARMKRSQSRRRPPTAKS